MTAATTPGVARLLEVCHACGSSVNASAHSCPQCSTVLSLESQSTPVPAGAHGEDTASSIDLIKHAQYRRIARLQSFVRLQSIGLAVLAGGCFVALVVYLTGLLDEQPVDPDVIEPVESVLATGAEAVDEEPELSVPPVVAPTEERETQPEMPAEVATSENTVDAGQNSLAAQEALENIRRAMRQVTPEQAALLRSLRTHLENAESSQAVVADRIDAIEQARTLIDTALETEQSDFFRLRLQALRAEFDKARMRIDAEASMGS